MKNWRLFFIMAAVCAILCGCVANTQDPDVDIQTEISTDILAETSPEIIDPSETTESTGYVVEETQQSDPEELSQKETEETQELQTEIEKAAVYGIQGNTLICDAYALTVERVMEEDVLGYTMGMLFDLDQDGIEELILTHCIECTGDGENVHPHIVYSIFTYEDGVVVSVCENEKICIPAGGNNGYAFGGTFKGEPVLIITSFTGSAYNRVDKYTVYNPADDSVIITMCATLVDWKENEYAYALDGENCSEDVYHETASQMFFGPNNAESFYDIFSSGAFGEEFLNQIRNIASASD